jgi:hypothetical protein
VSEIHPGWRGGDGIPGTLSGFYLHVYDIGKHFIFYNEYNGEDNGKILAIAGAVRFVIPRTVDVTFP